MQKYLVFASFLAMHYFGFCAALDRQLGTLSRSLKQLETTLKSAGPQPTGPGVPPPPPPPPPPSHGIPPPPPPPPPKSPGITPPPPPTGPKLQKVLPDVAGKFLDEAINIWVAAGITFPTRQAAQRALEDKGFTIGLLESIKLAPLVEKKEAPKEEPGEKPVIPEKLSGTFDQRVDQAVQFAREAIQQKKVEKDYNVIIKYLKDKQMYPDVHQSPSNPVTDSIREQGLKRKLEALTK